MDIIAHRGASFEAPENTLAAFRLAWAQGADAVACDIYLSRDGRIVAMHDPDTGRTAGVKIPIKAQDFAALQKLDAGSWKGEQWAGETIPALADILATVPAGKRIFIEIKCGPEILPELRRILAVAPVKPEQVVLICFDAKVLAAAKAIMSAVKTCWLAGFKQDEATGEWQPGVDKLLETAKQCCADGLDLLACPAVNRNLVNAVRKAGLELYVWTVDKPATVRRMQNLGIDGVTTNRPGWLRTQLGKQ